MNIACTDGKFAETVEPAAAYRQTSERERRTDAGSLHGLLAQAAEEASASAQLLECTAAIVAAATRASLIAWCTRPPQSPASPSRLQLLLGDSTRCNQTFQNVCLDLARSACESNELRVDRRADTEVETLVAAPVPRMPGSCLIAGYEGAESVPRAALVALQLAAAHVALWHLARDQEYADVVAEQLAAITELLARVESAEDLQQACQLLADALQGHLGCEHVVIGLCAHHAAPCRIVAASGTEDVTNDAPLTRRALDVLEEAIARGEDSVWPSVDGRNRHALLAHRQYAAETGFAPIVSSPLQDREGRVRGAWLMAGWASPTLRPETLNFVRAAQLPLASSFQLLVRAQRGPIHRALTAAVRLARGRRGLVLLGAIIGLVGLMLVPVPCQLRCDCELQPVVRRFVAAPFDGPLEKSLVEPGDVVVQDQLLAHMDGREIRWELAGTRADLHRAAKARAGHVATHESGKAELARYEVDRLQVRTELLEHRSDNLEIRSPVDGVVVSGDWKRAEGTPLKTGQTLFEIAPLDRMVLEVAVLERDVPYVEPGMPVRIRFDAFPLKSRTAAVESIHPRSELRDHANVFIAEVPVDNANRLLRPGMRGRAQVTGRPYPLGWNLFRRPIAAAIAWLGW